MVLFPEVPHLNPTGLNVVGSLLTANRLQESHQVGDQIERWRHRWINDKSQPDLGPGVQPHIAFLLSNIGNRVVEETNADVDQNNDDNHLQTKLIEKTDFFNLPERPPRDTSQNILESYFAHHCLKYKIY